MIYKTSDGKVPNYSWTSAFNIIADLGEAFGPSSVTSENKIEINKEKKETK